MIQKFLQSFLPPRDKLRSIIFGTDTPIGQRFDVILIVFIIASVLTVMLESVHDIEGKYHEVFYILEWFFTVFFTIEYILRLYCANRPIKYATSFYGVIDLLAILPTYLSLIFAGTQYLLVIRALRLLRVFRIFKMGHLLKEGNYIIRAMQASRAKIAVFLYFVLLMVTIIGSMMYLIEGESNPSFTNIPRSIYWAIVTLTTVGFGDITPQTGLGQFLSAIVMILGYAVIAVPTGIVSTEFIKGAKRNNKSVSESQTVCDSCGTQGHDGDAIYCKGCGEKL